MSSNLPPGISVGDIPGNRPEDEWWETFTEQLADALPSSVYDVPPRDAAEAIGAALHSLNRFAITAFTIGRVEGRIDAEEAAHDRMQEAEARLRREGLIEDDDGPMGSGIGDKRILWSKMMGSNKED